MSAIAVLALVLSSLVAVDSADAAPLARSSRAADKAEIPTTAPDPVSAQINARLSHHKVEVLSERTSSVQVFINPDGTVTRETAAAPVRVRDSSAKDGWADVDLDLAKQADGSIAPKQPLTDVTLSGGASDGSDLVTYEGTKGRSVSLDWKGALPRPALDGPVATYADVEPGVDLQVTATRFGFEESFVVKKRPADPGSLELPLSVNTDGLSVTDPNASPQSGMTVVDPDGKTVASVSPATTWDASVDQSGHPDNVSVSDLTLESSASGKDLVVKPSEAYLSDPATQYPVVIDPSFTVNSPASTTDTYVDSGNPNSNYVNTADLNAGTYNNGTSKARSYLTFAGTHIDHLPVLSASLSVWNFSSWSCTPSALDVYATTSQNLATTTWNSAQPTLVTSTKSSITAAQGSNGCGAGWLTEPFRFSGRFVAGGVVG